MMPRERAMSGDGEHGIPMQGEDWDDLKAMVREVALCHFAESMPRPRLIRPRYERDEVLLV